MVIKVTFYIIISGPVKIINSDPILQLPTNLTTIILIYSVALTVFHHSNINNYYGTKPAVKKALILCSFSYTSYTHPHCFSSNDLPVKSSRDVIIRCTLLSLAYYPCLDTFLYCHSYFYHLLFLCLLLSLFCHSRESTCIVPGPHLLCTQSCSCIRPSLAGKTLFGQESLASETTLGHAK